MSKKLEQAKALVDEIAAHSATGMTIDEMAQFCNVSRRTAERLRATINDSIVELYDIGGNDNQKHWAIRGKFSKAFSLPNSKELAALETEINSLNQANNARAKLLTSLLAKITASLEDKTRQSALIDVEALNKAQRIYVPAGPAIKTAAVVFTNIQQAILMGRLIEFDYHNEEYNNPIWRRIIPYGMIYGASSYLLGAIPDGKNLVRTYRLDRMENVRVSEKPGYPPEDFDLDEWMSQSFGIWQGDKEQIKLRILPHAAERGRNWRFHPKQVLTECDDGSLLVEFEASGLYELAVHLCGWAGSVNITAPQALKDEIKAIQSAEF